MNQTAVYGKRIPPKLRNFQAHPAVVADLGYRPLLDVIV
jgi:hypothetical protein